MVIPELAECSGPELQKILNNWNDSSDVKLWPPNPEASERYSVEQWLKHIKTGCEERYIPQEQWIEVATFFLRGELKELFIPVVQNREMRHKIMGWEDFETFMVDFHGPTEVDSDSDSDSEEVPPPAPDQLTDSRREKGKITKLAGGGLLAGGSAMVLPSAGVAALHAVGFTSSGVAAGSIAAGLQSFFYGGLTSGLFSICQSIGATAVIAPPVVIVIGVCAIVVGTLCVAFSASSARGNVTKY
ncbi:hypothetical protein Moror_5452 [Moniliophthora roreri MCA 2997]|uniref:Uncharacterized protein n=2 Tax=Moniliophthora roreri TaxID=221103 RepID=V2WMG3_MONRO|nr:hypothetical protein Moror_5452 [Moniliophthora roreri MCA 2997]